VTSVATGSGLSGGPITTTGTINLDTAYGDTINPYGSKTANTFLAAPNGAAGVPTFRAIASADVPTLNQNTTGNAATATKATNIAGGVAYQIPYQSAADTTTFIPVPTTASTYLSWDGSAFTWGTVSATVNWAVPGALGSTTPNQVFVSSGNSNAIAYFGGASGKQVLSNTFFKLDTAGNGTIRIQAAATNNYNTGSSFGYIAGGLGSEPSCFFGVPNNGADACAVSSNAYWDPDSGAFGDYIYDKTNSAAMWVVANGQHVFRTALSGTAGTPISWNTPLQLVGNLIYASTFATSIKTQSGSGIGYATGAGGAQTQSTSKSTAVTLNNICGKIQMAASALGATTSVSFTFNNNTIAETDVVIVNIATSATTNTYVITVDAVASGSCRIHLRNISATSRSEALVLNFAVIKAVQA
jgi:hypothetical protein